MIDLYDRAKIYHKNAKEKGFWKSKNIPEKLMLIVSELGEACEALRNNKRQEGDIWKKDTFEDEIADTFLRLFDLCGYMNIDIDYFIAKKIEYNKSRPYKHGKEF